VDTKELEALNRLRVDLSSVLTRCLFDGSSEGIAGFLTSFQVRDPLLESGSSTL
jgi:hypothetical protein